MAKVWVLGFAFDQHNRVALIEKRRGPSFLLGKLNGVGGKLAWGGEAWLDAMVREFHEECGVYVPNWSRFGQLIQVGWGVIQLFRAHLSPEQAAQVRTMEEEPVGWYSVRLLEHYNVVPNLRWLIPLALDRDQLFTKIEDRTHVGK